MEPKRVLVIDDEPEVCDLIRRILNHSGYRVDVVQAPPETVASLLVQRYDVVTVDLKMPDMDGVDVAELARVVDSRVPIVVISGFLTPNAKSRLRKLGIRHFLEKPFEARDLLAAFDTALKATPPPA